jgi:hypothetical protein
VKSLATQKLQSLSGGKNNVEQQLLRAGESTNLFVIRERHAHE